jgi:hypothetical protein
MNIRVDVAAIHHAEGAGIDGDSVEQVRVTHLAVGDAGEDGNRAVQVEQSAHFDGGLVSAEPGSRK